MGIGITAVPFTECRDPAKRSSSIRGASEINMLRETRIADSEASEGEP